MRFWLWYWRCSLAPSLLIGGSALAPDAAFPGLVGKGGGSELLLNWLGPVVGGVEREGRVNHLFLLGRMSALLCVGECGGNVDGCEDDWPLVRWAVVVVVMGWVGAGDGDFRTWL